MTIIHELREKYDCTAKELAEIAGVTTPTIYNWDRKGHIPMYARSLLRRFRIELDRIDQIPSPPPVSKQTPLTVEQLECALRRTATKTVSRQLNLFIEQLIRELRAEKRGEE